VDAGRHNFQKSKRDTPPVLIQAWGRHRVTVEIRYENPYTNTTTEENLWIEIFTPDYNFPEASGQRNSLNMRVYNSYFVNGPQVVWKDNFEGSRPKNALFSSEEIVNEALSIFIEALESYQPES
jgi:hypothetical protein